MNDHLPASWDEMSVSALWERLNDPQHRPTAQTNDDDSEPKANDHDPRADVPPAETPDEFGFETAPETEAAGSA